MMRAWPAALILLTWLTANAFAQDASTPEGPPPIAPPSTTPPAAPDNATPPAPSTTAPPPTANLETLVAADARSILGKKVSGAAGEDMGMVVDVLFDANKQPRAAVIDFGGFLGVGTRKIAIDWRLLQFYAPDSKTPLKIELSRADVQSAPEYKAGDKTTSVIAGPGPASTTPPPAATTPLPATPPVATPPDATTTSPASPPPAPSAPPTDAP
jgi:PRC-barrel domain protein